MLAARLDDVLGHFEVYLIKTEKYYIGRCPVHNGDNRSAFRLYINEDSPPRWKCCTRCCETTYQSSLLGFIRGMLSRRELTTFGQTINWACDFLQVKFDEIEVDLQMVESIKLDRVTNTITKGLPTGTPGYSEEVLKRLVMPSPYFLSRGYSREVLQAYKVGDALSIGKKFSQRAVIPIYNQDGRSIVGFTGRSLYEQCGQCQMYHSKGPCPRKEEENFFSKWYNSSMDKNCTLFNWNNALEHIERTNSVILVESPGDCLRAVEAGALNTVALLGAKLHDGQQCMLESSGVQQVVLLLNNDEAGNNGMNIARQMLQRSFRLKQPKLPEGANDVGDLSVDVAREFFLSL